MVVILIGLAVVAAVLTSGTGLFVVAVGNAIGSVWSNGVMANFRNDPDDAPSATTVLSMVTAAVAVVLIVIGLIIR
jgi:hypothetical protein